MVDPTCKPRIDSAINTQFEFCEPQLSSPAPSLPLRNGSQEKSDDQSTQQADPISSTHDATANDFVRTRSPLFIDQTDQATKHRYLFVEDFEDTDSDGHYSPSPRISPFAAEFMSADTSSPVFSRRKAALLQQLAEATIDAEKSQVESEQQSASPKTKDLAPKHSSIDSPPEPGTCQEDSTDQDTAEERSKDVHATTERPDISEYMENADLREEKGTTRSITTPGILTILDEEIDQQFTDKGYISLEPDSTNSSSLTLFVPEVSEEPQPIWNPDLCGALDEAVSDAIATVMDLPFHTRPSDTCQTQQIREHQVDSTKESLDEENSPFTLQSQGTENSYIDRDQDSRSADDAVALAQSCGTLPSQQVDVQRLNQHARNSPNAASSHASPISSPHTLVLIDSPDGSEKIVHQPLVPQPVPTQSTILINQNEFSPPQDRRNQASGSEHLVKLAAMEEETLSLLDVKCYEWDLFPNRRPLASSVVSSKCDTHCEDDSPTAAPEVEEGTLPPVVPDQYFVQTQMLINQALQESKADLLRQMECLIQQSIAPLITTKNSAAAAILARPLPPNLESAIRSNISSAQEEITSRIDSNKAEAIGYALRMAETTKAHSTGMADALKNTLVKHIDHRLENLEKMFATLETESSTQNKAFLKKLVTGLLPFESFDALKKVPELVEQSNTHTITNAKETSKKLEEYAAKTEAVSNLCTRLDETITSNQHLQSEIINSLYNILNQSTLQNNAINNLATVIDPLAKLVKGISYDTNLIDAKLAKNADILVSIIDRTEALEKAAGKFGRIMVDAECKLKIAMTKMDQAAKVASSVNATHTVERFEAIQGQMTTIKAQLDQIAAAVAKQDSVKIHGIGSVSDTPPPAPAEQANDSLESVSELESDKLSTQVEFPNSQPDPPTFTIDASFQLPSSRLLKLPHPTTLSISESSTVFTILSNFRSYWTKELLKQGIITAKMELVSIWVLSAKATSRRVVDNDTTYRGWYKAVTTRHFRGDQLLHFEFLDCANEVGSGTEEPKSKKRKQEVMRRGSEAGVKFSLDIWRNARQMRYEQVYGDRVDE